MPMPRRLGTVTNVTSSCRIPALPLKGACRSHKRSFLVSVLVWWGFFAAARHTEPEIQS